MNRRRTAPLSWSCAALRCATAPLWTHGAPAEPWLCSLCSIDFCSNIEYNHGTNIHIYICSSLWKSMVHVPQFLASINLLTLIYQAVNYTQCDSHAMTALYLNDANVISSHYGKFNQSDFFLYIFFLVKQVHLCIFRSRRASHWLLSFAI